jgi:flagellar biosynthesis anti-sigma factor FlgM
MKIQLPASGMVPPESNQAVAAHRSHRAVVLDGPGTRDTTGLSTGHDQVQTLAANLNQVPEVRQQRVEALRQSVLGGSYEISPGRIAAAMLSEVS